MLSISLLILLPRVSERMVSSPICPCVHLPGYQIATERLKNHSSAFLEGTANKDEKAPFYEIGNVKDGYPKWCHGTCDSFKIGWFSVYICANFLGVYIVFSLLCCCLFNAVWYLEAWSFCFFRFHPLESRRTWRSVRSHPEISFDLFYPLLSERSERKRNKQENQPPRLGSVLCFGFRACHGFCPLDVGVGRFFRHTVTRRGVFLVLDLSRCGGWGSPVTS